ncbi:DUF58 domain-containing protein [uncultured Bifidobacterium sp.]|uniref:DUF58 domain-containing protein n=1 Tax=uncultured Bifidobacterium sp. TaxID=165187 RepID=UPI0028DAFCB7|nr:DUF58 domain-containing protein [uncultured Bifidobacterium sp.]
MTSMTNPSTSGTGTTRRRPLATTLPRRVRFLRRFGRGIRHALLAFVSPLGWIALALATACAGGFLLLGWHELLASALALVAMLLCGLMMSLGNTRIRASIGVASPRVTAGSEVVIHVDVANPGRASTAAAHGDLPLGDVHRGFVIPPLIPGTSRRTDVSFTAASRAVLTIGPLRVRKGDPFALVRHERATADILTVYVHPRIVPLPELDAGVRRDLEGRPSGQIVDDDLDFHGLREYRPGDDIRNVHWLSTAKAGELMIRQFEATRRTDTSLTIGVNPEGYAGPEEFELAVSVLASIGVQCLERHRPLTVHAGDAHHSPTTPGILLDLCSGIRPDDGEKPNLAQDTLLRSPDASFYFFVVGSLRTAEDVRRMTLPLPSAATRVVVRCRFGRPKSVRRSRGLSLATVGSLEDLPLVLGALA